MMTPQLGPGGYMVWERISTVANIQYLLKISEYLINTYPFFLKRSTKYLPFLHKNKRNNYLVNFISNHPPPHIHASICAYMPGRCAHAQCKSGKRLLTNEQPKINSYIYITHRLYNIVQYGTKLYCTSRLYILVHHI